MKLIFINTVLYFDIKIRFIIIKINNNKEHLNKSSKRFKDIKEEIKVIKKII